MIKQRIYWLGAKKEEYDKLLKCIKDNPGGCDEIWFGIIKQCQTVAEIEKNIDDFLPLIENLKALGIKISVEIKTFGDQTTPNAEYDFSGLDHVDEDEFSVDAMGHVNFGQFCWRSESWRSYRRKVIALICKKIQPYAIYFDDDMRVFNWNSPLRCFCKRCVAEFNRRFKTSYTREEIEALLRTDMDVREKYLLFSYQSMAEFCYDMGLVIKENSKITHAGVQHGSYSGHSYIYALKALHEATDRPVMSRSGGGAYTDDNPNLIVEKTFDTQFQLALLPDYVQDRCNEIENYPHVYYTKTLAGMCLESTLHLASGFNSVSYMFTNSLADKQYLFDAIAELSKRRKYYERLKKAGEGCVKGGLNVVVPHKYWANSDEQWMVQEPWRVGHEFNFLSIPITFAKTDNSVSFLPTKYAETITKDELEALALKPVVIYGGALEILEKRGFSYMFGARAVRIDNAFPYYESFTEHEVNEAAGIAEKSWGQALFYRDAHYIEDKDGFTQILSVFDRYNKKVSAPYAGKPASAFINTCKGARWLVLGYREGDEFVSFDKKLQLVSAIEELGGLSCDLKSVNRLMLLPLERNDGKITCVTVCNTTIEEQVGSVIEVKKPIGDKAVFWNEFGEQTVLKTQKTDSGIIFTLPNVAPWKAATVFFE